MNAYIDGVVQGAKEGPLIFVAPLIALWRCFVSTTESLLDNSGR